MNKSYCFLLILTLLWGCQPPEKPVAKYSIEQFYKNISVGGGSFSSDESKILVHSNESGIYNIYEIDIATGVSKALTSSEKDSYYSVGYFPGEDRFLYTADQGGNENYHLYMQMPEGDSKDLTPQDSVQNGFVGWSRDDKSIFISSNKRDKRFRDIYEKSIASLDDEFMRKFVERNPL